MFFLNTHILYTSKQLLMMAYEESESTRDNFGKFIYQLQPETKTLIRKLERILNKLYRQNLSLLFNETCLNERLLPNHTHTHTHTHTHIYIYIELCDSSCMCVCGYKQSVCAYVFELIFYMYVYHYNTFVHVLYGVMFMCIPCMWVMVCIVCWCLRMNYQGENGMSCSKKKISTQAVRVRFNYYKFKLNRPFVMVIMASI